MSSARTVAGLDRVAVALEDRWGITVHRVPGWERRGRGTLTPRGWVCHHTGPGSWSVVLRILTHGRRDLANSLCTFGVRLADGDAFLVAAGTSWHAGAGGWLGLRGNAVVGGTEAQHPGDGTPWTAASLRTQLAICVEACLEFGFAADHVADHREWAPTRKVDRAGISGPDWRRRIRTALTQHQEDTDMTPAQAQLLQQVAATVARLERQLKPVDLAASAVLEAGDLIDDETLDRIAEAVRDRLQPKGGAAAGDELDMLRRAARRLLEVHGIDDVKV